MSQAGPISGGGITGTVAVNQGGTGQTSLTAHNVILGEGTSAVGFAAPGTTGYPLLSTGATTDPAFAQLSLTAGVTGMLPVGNGGTGAATFTAHTILAGEGTSAISAIGPGSAGQVLQSGGASANPAYSTATYPLTTAQGDLLLSSAANTITTLGKNSNATRYLSNTGTTNNAAWAQVALTTGVSGTLPVGNGGLGVASPTAHAILVGEGASAVSPIGPLTSGQFLIGSTGADPVAALITAGSNITLTPGAGSLTIASTGALAISWTLIGASQTLAINSGYVCTTGAALSLALPATAALGSMIAVTLDGSTSWAITQGSGQQIRFGNVQTTSGAGGSLTSTAAGDTIYMVCTVANTRWNVVFSIGNITVV